LLTVALVARAGNVAKESGLVPQAAPLLNMRGARI
jgi:hypothetical protein